MMKSTFGRSSATACTNKGKKKAARSRIKEGWFDDITGLSLSQRDPSRQLAFERGDEGSIPRRDANESGLVEGDQSRF